MTFEQREKLISMRGMWVEVWTLLDGETFDGILYRGEAAPDTFECDDRWFTDDALVAAYLELDLVIVTNAVMNYNAPAAGETPW